MNLQVHIKPSCLVIQTNSSRIFYQSLEAVGMRELVVEGMYTKEEICMLRKKNKGVKSYIQEEEKEEKKLLVD